ncbi:MAG: hypothetical protein M3548_08180 [Actinomycetota bacterium]|nr:hypothetical protein [Actinomycetota bacterium]
MARPERPVDPSAGPLQAFACDLRALRRKAGSPNYEAMSSATGKSKTALTQAAAGDHLPRWETLAAYVLACGGETEQWRHRWERLRDTLGVHIPGPRRARANLAAE